jgi:hypothetical protein
METITATTEETVDRWKHFHDAVQSLGEFADQVERSLAPTAKQQFIKTMEIGETLSRLTSVNEEIIANLQTRGAVTVALSRVKSQMDEAKALILIGGTIDGKNAEIRDAQLLVALKNDPGYVDARRQVDEVERAIAGVDVALESLRGQQAALKINLRLIAAQIEYLAEPR